MAAVFAFLTLLVLMMRASATFFTAFGDRFTEGQPPTLKAEAPRPAASDDIATVLAIAEQRRAGNI